MLSTLFLSYLSFGLVIILTILYSIYKLFDASVYDLKGKKLPGPIHHFFDDKFLSTFVKCVENKQIYVAISHIFLPKYSNDFFGVKIFGEKWIVIADPEIVKPILSGSHNKYIKTHMYTRLESMVGKGLVTSQGAKWQLDRKMISPGFHADELKDMINTFNSQTSLLVNDLLSRFDNQSSEFIEINLDKDILDITLRIILLVGFGFDINKQVDSKELREIIQILFDEISLRLGDPTDWWYNICFQRQRIFNKAMNKFHKLADRLITERLESNTKSNRDKDILDILIDVSTNNSDYKLSLKELKDHMFTFIIAGSDTTAASLLCTLYELANHPDIQTKCYNEIKSLYNGNKIKYEDISKYTYLHQVIKECLRLHAPAANFGRHNTEVITVNDYEIPKYSLLWISVYSIHRNPKYWENPNEFNPDRFTSDKVSKFHPFQYIPFSLGPRNCIGQRFATIELVSILVPLLYHFELYIDDKQKSEIIYEETIVYHLKNVNCNIKKRSHI